MWNTQGRWLANGYLHPLEAGLEILGVPGFQTVVHLFMDGFFKFIHNLRNIEHLETGNFLMEQISQVMHDNQVFFHQILNTRPLYLNRHQGAIG